MNRTAIPAQRLILLLGMMALIAVAWRCLSPGHPPTLAEGLQYVDVLDGENVDRIERDLNARGQSDEATVLRCAWLSKRGQHHEVLRLLPRRLEQGPLRVNVLRIVGTTLFHLGEQQQAEVALTTLVSEFPDEVDAYRLLGAIYYDLGSNDLALKALSHVQRLSPRDYRPHHLAGIILADAEKFPQAIQELHFALEKGPPGEIESDIRHELARSLMKIHSYQDAIEVLKLDSASPRRSALLGECYWSLGDKDQALREVEFALQIAPTDAASLRIKGQLLEDAGMLDEAIAILRQVLSFEPYDVESRYRLVQMLAARGLTEQHAQEQAEYLRYRKLQDRLVELNLKASEDPDAVEPRRELITVCQELGRVRLAEMWARATRLCEQRLQARGDAVRP